VSSLGQCPVVIRRQRCGAPRCSPSPAAAIALRRRAVGGAPHARTAAIATLGVGLGTVLWLGVVARSFEQSVLDVMPGVLRADLAVSSAHIGAGYVEAPVDEALLTDLMRVPGVAAVVGEQAIDWTYDGGPISINAFDPAYFSDPAFAAGRWSGGIFPVSGRASRAGRRDRLGQLVAIPCPRRRSDQPRDAGNSLAVRIAGVTPDFLSPRGTIG
jgi:hypothetical protein